MPEKYYVLDLRERSFEEFKSKRAKELLKDMEQHDENHQELSPLRRWMFWAGLACIIITIGMCSGCEDSARNQQFSPSTVTIKHGFSAYEIMVNEDEKWLKSL